MPEPPGIYYHVANCLENCIIVLSGSDEYEMVRSLRNIWMYNMYTEQWRKHVIPAQNDAPPRTEDFCAVVIEGDIYMFGGWVAAEDRGRQQHFTNALWKLTRTPNQCFKWREVMARNKKKIPSPRECHSGWEYNGQLWTSGGYGLTLEGYLNDHGDFSGTIHGKNNQLLCYDPWSQDWRNLKPSGTVPEPHSEHTSTIIGDKVSMYGGFSTKPNRIYQLSMVSLTWTEILSGQPKPRYREMCSLIAVTEDQIVLHGGSTSKKRFNDTWILDLPSLSWTRYEASQAKPRSGHTGNVGIGSSIIIIGGIMDSQKKDGSFDSEIYNDAFSVKLEPKTLQQLAIQKIHHHKDVLPWKRLPNLLQTRFLFPVVDADEGRQKHGYITKQQT